MDESNEDVWNWQSEFVTDSNIIVLLVNMNANANSKIDD